MFKPRLKFLTQLLSNSTPKTLQSSQLFSLKSKPSFNFNLTRTISSTTSKNSSLLDNEIHKFVAKSPESSLVPLLERRYGENNEFQPDEDIRNVIRKLRRQKRFDRALEVSEWMMSKTPSDPTSGDLATQLSLIGLVHGVDAAEKFFNEVDVHSEKMYAALLNCYVEAKLVDKSLSHFEKMKNMGLPMSALSYNNIMTLYMNTNQDEKVPEVLPEMEENGVSPDNFSYRVCLKSFASRSDFAGMENLLRKMEGQHGLVIDWLTYAVVANYYIEGGSKDKAFYYLEKAELKVKGDPVGCNSLMTSYAKIGGLTQVKNLWRQRRNVSKAHINNDYMTMINSLVKLDQLEEAERFLHEWESCCSSYDFRVVNALLLGYTNKGLVEKAEKLLEGIISRKLMPAPNTWFIICTGHIKCQNMHKALLFLKKALELSLASQHPWIPYREVISSMLKWLGDEGEIGEVEEFLKLYSKVVPMDEQMYQTLLTANIRHGNEVDDILQRMKHDNIEISEETRKIAASRT